MRAGVHTKACGVAVIASMAVCFFLPVSLVTVVPSCFFGSVLCFIAVELIFEWLIESKERCTRAEYFVVWVTFIAINLFGVEAGMGIGIIAQILAFVILYARSGNLLTQRYWHSNVIRGYKQRSLSSKLHREIVTLEMHGFIFFGSAVRILDHVRSNLFRDPTHRHHRQSQLQNLQSHSSLGSASSSSAELKTRGPIQYLILDFYHVTGLDSTGAATCFVTLCQRAEELGITLLFCHVPNDARQVLEVQQVLPRKLEPASEGEAAQAKWPIQEFKTTDEALAWCETQSLRQISALPVSPVADERRRDGSAEGSGVAEVLSAFLTQYMLPDVRGGMLAEDRAIEGGPGSVNPFGAPPRQSQRPGAGAAGGKSRSLPRLRSDGDGLHVLGMRHRVPSRRAVASSLAEAAAIGDGEGSEEHADGGASGKGRRSGRRGRRAAEDGLSAAHVAEQSSQDAVDISAFFERVVFQPGEQIYAKGDVADAMFVLESGCVGVFKAPKPSGPAGARKLGGRRPDRGKLLRYESGTIFGEVEFFLRHRRYFTMKAKGEKESVVHRLSWAQFDQLQATQPHLACAFHTAVMRWACRWVAVDINDGRRHHGSDRFMADIEG